MAEQLPYRGSSTSATDAAEPDGDWPATVTASIVRVVDQINANTTRRAIVVVRALVYGLVAALVGIVIAVLLFIGVFRALDRLRNLIVEDAVWLTYLSLGLLMTIAGAYVFSLRKPRS